MEGGFILFSCNFPSISALKSESGLLCVIDRLLSVSLLMFLSVSLAACFSRLHGDQLSLSGSRSAAHLCSPTHKHKRAYVSSSDVYSDLLYYHTHTHTLAAGLVSYQSLLSRLTYSYRPRATSVTAEDTHTHTHTSQPKEWDANVRLLVLPCDLTVLVMNLNYIQTDVTIEFL